jgi:hypothetical protein
MILEGQKEENAFLNERLKEASAWYKQPGVTIPATATFMLILFTMVGRSK